MPEDRQSRTRTGLRELFAAPWLMLVRHLPGPLGVRLRRGYWGRRLGSLGDGVRIDEGVKFFNPGQIHIGSRCWIAADALIAAGAPSLEGREAVRRPNPDFRGAEGEVRIGDDVELAVGSVISGSGGIEVGDNVSLGPGAKLFSASNHYRGPDGEPGVRSAGAGMRREPGGGMGRQSLLIGPVVIEPEAFVGTQAVVLPGVTIGRAAWLGAGVIARRSLEGGRVYAPAEPALAQPG
jgi:acetyltransferase-like isoleucine patch superfamily enzyme